MQRLIPALSLAIYVLTIFSACDDGTATAVIQDKQEYTIEDQVDIGDHLTAAIKNDPTKYDVLNANAYEPVYTYLNSMLRSAVITEQVVMREDFSWEIIPLIDDSDAFAYSMPGGKIVVSTAMLQFLDNEAELLALLSCEIYYTDVDLHTKNMKDEFSGIRLGSIVLGSDTKSPDDLINFLRNQTFTEEDVVAADRRAIAVMCPFNYDVNSLRGFIERTNAGIDMNQWNSKRPRPANWNEIFTTAVANCNNDSAEKFQSRYEGIKAQLPQ